MHVRGYGLICCHSSVTFAPAEFDTVFTKLTKTERFYLTIFYTSVRKNTSITVIIFILKSFYRNVFRLVYNELASG